MSDREQGCAACGPRASLENPVLNSIVFREDYQSTAAFGGTAMIYAQQWLPNTSRKMKGLLLLSGIALCSSCVDGNKQNASAEEPGIREFLICPSDSIAEVVSTLRLGSTTSITLTQLELSIIDMNYSFENGRYGVSRYSCEPGAISPDEQAIIVSAGFDATNSYVRKFYILADDTGLVEQIELRKGRPAP